MSTKQHHAHLILINAYKGVESGLLGDRNTVTLSEMRIHIPSG